MPMNLGLHETLEVHELVTFKNLCVTKAATMGLLVQDAELKMILGNDVSAGQKHLAQLQQLLTKGGEQA